MAIIIGCYLVFNISKIKSLHRKFLKVSVIIWTVIPFILFSLSKSKLIWYINTTYPALTILMAWICYSILKNKNVADKAKCSILIVLILSTLCGEVSIIHKIKVNTQKEAFVKNKVRGLYLLDNNDENRKFLNLNSCKVVVKNTNFIIIKQ
ncbi:MAG: hypothetical protein PHX70_00230 [Clostridium sp.]|nr:hypothetical protein [Clostridium sp.]